MTPTSTPTPTAQEASNNLPLWLVVVALGVIVIAVGGYFLVLRK
jgi:hypothetical protein